MGILAAMIPLGKRVLKEGNLTIKEQKKKLKQIIKLIYPEKAALTTNYLETDATYLKLQDRGKKRKLEVKLDIGYTDKEARYNATRLKCSRRNSPSLVPEKVL